MSTNFPFWHSLLGDDLATAVITFQAAAFYTSSKHLINKVPQQGLVGFHQGMQARGSNQSQPLLQRIHVQMIGSQNKVQSRLFVVATEKPFAKWRHALLRPLVTEALWFGLHKPKIHKMRCAMLTVQGNCRKDLLQPD
jgi:hypothetical protein